MSFYKIITENAASAGASDDEVKSALKDSEAALNAGYETFKKVTKIMVADSKAVMANSKNPKLAAMNATMLLFSVGWHIIGWLWKGVHPGFEAQGNKNTVYRLWRLMEATFGTHDEKQMAENVAKLHKEWGVDWGSDEDE